MATTKPYLKPRSLLFLLALVVFTLGCQTQELPVAVEKPQVITPAPYLPDPGTVDVNLEKPGIIQEQPQEPATEEDEASQRIQLHEQEDAEVSPEVKAEPQEKPLPERGLKLVAIIRGGRSHRAMLEDASGFGHIVKAGDRIGPVTITAITKSGVTLEFQARGETRQETLPLGASLFNI